MGVTYGLELFQPAVFDRTKDLFAKGIPSIVEEAKRAVTDKYVLESLGELSDEEDDGRADILNSVFLVMAREQSWDLDKCFRAGIETVFRAVPMLHPLKRKFIDFAEGDIELPQNIVGAEGGLYVVWSSQAIQDCLPAVDQLKTANDVEAVISNSSFSFVQKTFGGVARARKGLEAIARDDYSWGHWQSFREAISLAAKGKYLGFSLYP